MLPVATHASHKDSFGSIAELSVFSLVPPDEERRDCQAMDGPVGYLGRSTSFTRHRSSYDIKFSSGDNTSYVAQTLAHDPNVNCYTPRSVLDSTSSPSHNEVNQKPPSRLRSLDQRDYAICNRSGYSTAKKEVLKSQSYYAIRQDLLARLEQGSSEDGLGKELKVMISMMARMNTLLLGLSGITIVGAPKISMNAHTINQGTAVAAQMKHYFNSLGQKYENQLGNIAAIKNYLPFLGPNVKSTLVRTALKIWNERIVITYVDFQRRPDKRKLKPKAQRKPRFSSAPPTTYLHPPFHLLRYPSLHNLSPQAAIPLGTSHTHPSSYPTRTHPALHGARLRYPRSTYTRDRKPSESNE